MENRISVDAMIKSLEQGEYRAEACGNTQIAVDSFCSLNRPHSNALTWIKKAGPDSLKGFETCDNMVVVAKECVPSPCKNICFLITDSPKAVFFSLLRQFWYKRPGNGIAETAVVESKNIAEGVSIGHHCYIGPDVTIGAGTVIEHNVMIYNTVTIGENCFIHSGTVIGTDATAGFIGEEGWVCRADQFGSVKIGDDVEIGANTCIDRGTIDATVLGDHVKVSDLVHIGHNTQVLNGACIMVGAILCGSVTLGVNSYVAPGAMVKNQLKVGDNGFIGMGGVALRNVEPDIVVAGNPARPLKRVQPGDK